MKRLHIYVLTLLMGVGVFFFTAPKIFGDFPVGGDLQTVGQVTGDYEAWGVRLTLTNNSSDTYYIFTQYRNSHTYGNWTEFGHTNQAINPGQSIVRNWSHGTGSAVPPNVEIRVQWYDSGTTIQINSTQIFDRPSQIIPQDYWIYYYDNDGSGITVNPQLVTENTNFITRTLTRPHAELLGWSLVPNSDIVTYQPNTSYLFDYNANLSLYAVWEVDSYYLGYQEGYANGDGVGYDRARGEYGILINGVWLSATEYGQQQYDKGLIDGGSADYGMFGFLGVLFSGLGSLLAIQLFPNITIASIIAVPLVFGIIAFIVGKRGGKD